MNYIFVDSISKQTGKPTERALYRRGETVELNNLGTGQSLLIRYDDNTATVTSDVLEIDAANNRLIIETLNSVYTFDEVVI